MELKERRTLLIFYLLAFYIFCQITWWGYSLLDVHLKLISLQAQEGKDPSSRIYMVVGEGLVFLIIFLLGTWRVQRNIRRDFMHARIEKTFLLSVTHELKTPIAILRLMMETLKKKDVDSQRQKEIVEGALEETYRLEQLVENILYATRLNQQVPSLHLERVSLSGLVDRAIGRFQAEHRNRIVRSVEEDVFVVGDEQSILILVSNLVDNALKYSPPKEKIDIWLLRDDAGAVLVVSDRGPGIPTTERKKVLEKFYRIGNEETRNHRGTGLGLYIVARIAALHGGKLEIRENEWGGAHVVVSLPAA